MFELITAITILVLMKFLINLFTKILNSHNINHFRQLSKCPGGYPILQRSFKLNSENSAGKNKRVRFNGTNWFSTGKLSKNVQSKYLDHFHYQCCLKKYRDSIKRVLTLAKIQSARKASHHLTMPDNWQTFTFTCPYPIFRVKVQCFSGFFV